MLPRPPVILLYVCRSTTASLNTDVLVCCFVFAGDFSPFPFSVLRRVHCFRDAHHDVSARRRGRARIQGVAVRGAGIRNLRAEAKERVIQVRERVRPEPRVRVAHEKILLHTCYASPETGLILSNSRVNGEYCGRKEIKTDYLADILVHDTISL